MSESSDEKWIEAGLMALASEGIGAVRVEALARGLGLSKGSFYHHFKNRRALLDRMLARWSELGTEALISYAEREGDAGERFRRLARAIFTVTEMDNLEVAIRAWGTTDEEVARVLGEVDARRLDYVRGLFIDVGMTEAIATARSEAFYRVVIGDFMWRSVGGEALSADYLEETVALFLGECERGNQGD